MAFIIAGAGTWLPGSILELTAKQMQEHSSPARDEDEFLQLSLEEVEFTYMRSKLLAMAPRTRSFLA